MKQSSRRQRSSLRRRHWHSTERRAGISVPFDDHMTKAYLIDRGMAQRHEVSDTVCHGFTE